MRFGCSLRLWLLRWHAAALAAAGALQPSIASAHERGIAVDDCRGCHGGGTLESPTLSLTSEPASFEPGDAVTLALEIRAPGIRVGGAYISSGQVGALQALTGEGLSARGAGLSHTAPQAAEGGVVTYRFGWRAPSAPGAVSFDVAAVAGNGNRASSGDATGFASFQWVFGCAGRTFFVDLDRDGYGARELGVRLSCADAPAPVGFAAVDGDCDENDEKAHPGATEVCNKKDDDCDGEVDEGAQPVPMWPDPDGDGFYQFQTGTAKSGCGDIPGYAALPGDCDELDPHVSPAATEICNNRDDDCDGDVDEHVRPQCGVGWCARYSSSCDAKDCEPGPPTTETCNTFDDDCDGVVDNDACSAGAVCSRGQCVAPDGVTEEPSEAPLDEPSGQGGTSLRPPSEMAPPAPAAKSPERCSTHAVPRLRATWLMVTVLLSAWALGRRRRSRPRALIR